MTAKITRDPDPLMPDFSVDAEGPTVEQPGLAPGESANPTIRQKVAMALKQGQGHSADQTAELAIDDLGLDLGALDTVDQPGLGAASDAPTLVAGMDERSRRVMEEAQRRAASENQDTAATVAWQTEPEIDLTQIDATEIEATEFEPTEFDTGHRTNGRGAAAEVTAFDSSSTARLAALSSEEVDFDLGEDEPDHTAHTTNGSGLDLDVGTATVPDTQFTNTQKLASGDLALPDLEPVTMSEVGTKLDLARAYMDMGDPEGARNILEEVLHEGSVAQKQEAKRLLESLPG
jgi:FimV-like protein